jgi:hypothetical protein
MGIPDPSATASTEATAQPRAPRIDLLTVGAIAIVAYLISVFTHEALGHGVATLLVGGHVNRVTSVDLESSAVSHAGLRFIAAAGCLAQFILAGVLLASCRSRPPANPNTRYFGWLLAHVSLFMAAGYLMVLSFVPFGDWHVFAAGLPGELFVRIGLTALGIAVSFAALISAARTLDIFLGRDTRARGRRAVALTLTPYLVGSAANTLAGALNPVSALLILSSGAAASFGGTSFLAWTSFWVRGPRDETPETPRTPTRSTGWIAAGVAALLIYLLVLGPGIPRTSLL